MMIRRFIFGLLMAVGCFGCAVGPRSDGADKLANPRRVFLVRHAERFADGEDPNLILTPLQISILEIMLETDNNSLLVEDQPYPIPSRIWERLSRPVGERI